MSIVEFQDTGRIVTRRRHVIVEHKRPAGVDSTSHVAPSSSPAAGGRTIAGDAGVVNAEQLFAGQSTVAIRHNGATYTLRMTRFGKLILTK